MRVRTRGRIQLNSSGNGMRMGVKNGVQVERRRRSFGLVTSDTRRMLLNCDTDDASREQRRRCRVRT